MPDKRPAEKGGQDGQDGPGPGSKRVIRSLGMSDDEWKARERRREEFRARREAKTEKPKGPQESGNNGILGEHEEETEASIQTDIPRTRQTASSALGNRKRKPWETLAIGNLGENLSHIQRKDREIEQQRYIVQYHRQHSPRQVEHNEVILNRLLLEREQMEDNDENNMPQDQREAGERMRRRLEVLRWALGTSKCEEERINIEAAIHGYETGRIPYSTNFTLIYGGNIVDTCPTYNSFCTDRQARLDRYYAQHGSGWLWQEPPLAGRENVVLAKKGVCLGRNRHHDNYHVGNYQIRLEFVVHQDKVSKSKPREGPKRGRKKRDRPSSGDGSCQVDTLLDSGATFPIILQSDLAWLNIKLDKYAAQGVMDLQIVGGKKALKFYEMYVSICSGEGDSLVGQGDEAIWPNERRTLGGFYPVLAIDDPPGTPSYQNRLSGLVPFDVCYMSLAPGTNNIWIGEDRRDVLGTNRMPAHLRYDSDQTFSINYPQEFEHLRKEARTPDRVIFLHEFPDKPGILLTDSDTLGARGKSELAIGRYQMVDNGPGKPKTRKAVPQRVVQIEPRKGNVDTISRNNARPWQADFLSRRTSSVETGNDKKR
ncbi:hypothetical protein GGS20DRAFT_508658 [Poronia punctata]|nr:hypothetical protein GGS20DRAFT_508658 [Poronia punctata]